MNKKSGTEDKSTWATGGGLMIGIGVGFFFLHQSPLFFVGCIMGGLGFGLIITSIISSLQKNQSS